MARFVYVDEAGISHKKQEPWLTVAGVIVHIDHKLNPLEKHLQRLIERHIPPKNREGFIFHAKEIFNGGGIFKRGSRDLIGPIEWPLSRRLAIADDLAAIIPKFDLQIAVGVVERATFPHVAIPEMRPGEETLYAHVAAYMTCAMFVEQWFRQNASNESCLMVVENNDTAKTLIKKHQQEVQNPRITATLGEQERKHFPLRKIKEDPLFQEKSNRSVLQVADFCAYVIKRALMEDDHIFRFYDVLKSKIISFDDAWIKRRLSPEKPA